MDGGEDGADARRGLGWSLARGHLLDQAIAQFSAAIGFSAEDAASFAGRAAAARDTAPPQFQYAMDSADSALALDPAFAFARDPGVDWRDLRLIIAQAAFGLGDYARAIAEVDSLPGGMPPDPGSPDLPAELLLELERLGGLLHPRVRPGAGTPGAAAGGDPAPPVLQVRVLQNPLLPANLHLYLVSGEPLDPATIHIEDHGNVIAMAAAGSDSLLFRGYYRAGFEGVHHFETLACDPSGNCTEDTFAAPIHLAPGG